MKYVIYIRGSTDKQKLTLDVQEQLCIKLCEGHEYKLFRDKGGKGGKLIEHRTVLMDALAALQAGDVFLVPQPDRLARESDEIGAIKYLVRQVGATLAYADGTKITDASPEERLQEVIKNGVAEYERHKINLRIRVVLENKKQKGEKLGGVVKYGFRAVLKRDGTDVKVLKPCKEELEAIKCIYNLHDEGLSIRKLIGSLTERGFKTRAGTPFQPTMVHKILKRRKEYAPYIRRICALS